MSDTFLKLSVCIKEASISQLLHKVSKENHHRFGNCDSLKEKLEDQVGKWGLSKCF